MKWSFIQLTETWGKPHSIIHHTLAGYEHVYDIMKTSRIHLEKISR